MAMTVAEHRNRPLKVLLLILALLALVLYSYLVLTGAFKTASDQVSPSRDSVESSDVSLWDAYGVALDVVRAQASDVQLVSAATQWRAAAEGQLLAGANTWSFGFYSQSLGSTFDVGVGTGGARIVSETQVWHKPQILVEGEWRKGPQDAILIFLAYGGREFIGEYPDAAVDVHLGATDDDRPVWMIVGVGDQDSAPKVLRIDAETGTVLLNSFKSGG